MRRIILILLLGLYFGAFAYFGIAPQYALAASCNTHTRVTISAQLTHSAEKTGQEASGIPWPSINLPDFSFLWRQQNSNQKKDIYDRGQ